MTPFNPKTPADPTNSNPLDWLAFRYVTGEMTDEESAAWELQLADDQLAREAVAGAVEVLQTLSQLPQDSWYSPQVAVSLPRSLTPVAARPFTARSWKFVFSAMAATVAIVALFVVSQAIRDDRSSAMNELDADAELATAWSLTRVSSAATTIDEPLVDSTHADADEWQTTADIDPITSDRPMPNTPSWMLAGMAGLVEEHEDSDPIPEPAATKEL